MTDKPPPSDLNVSAPPSSTSTSSAATPFTPRSSTFPDGIDSDDEGDFFVPTPSQSPDGVGPRYDDLPPPSYDEAQQQALHDARNGVPPVNPDTIGVYGGGRRGRDAGSVNTDTIGVHRLHLDDNTGVYQIPPHADVRAHRATPSELEKDRRDRNVPVQHVGGVEGVPVGRVGGAPALPQVNQQAVLLSAALEFAKHGPDGDVRYAPRLTRCVAIPGNYHPLEDERGSKSKGKGKGKGKQRESEGCKGRHGRREGRNNHHVPGQWPGSSHETLSSTTQQDGEDEPTEFLRAYAKALHAHSIRPAEFLDFLDGLNALCSATGTTPTALTNASADKSSLIHKYLTASNDLFFAPRNLKVSIKPLTALLSTANIPSENGQRAGAIVTALDTSLSSAARAQSLHPWIEALEVNVPEMSTSVLVLREMAMRMGCQPGAGREAPRNEDPPISVPGAAADVEEDPPHSVPRAYPSGAQDGHGWQYRGNGRGWGAHRGQAWSPFGGASGNPRSGPPGFGPFGAGRGSFSGPPGRTPFGAHANGPWALPRGRPGGPSQPTNSWQAWGEHIGKMGEEFGRKMEVWGDQFGRDAAAWGEEIGRKASGAAGGGRSVQGQGPPGYSSYEGRGGSASLSGAVRGLGGQEAGVVREGEKDKGLDAKEKKKKGDEKKKDVSAHGTKKTIPNDDDYDSDSSASSISSSSSSSSDSDSEDDDDPSTLFTHRIHTINTSAQTSLAKGKKSPSTISTERSAAISRASRDHSALERKRATKQAKRAVKREFRAKKREMRKEYREERRRLKREGKGKKSREWREMRERVREGKRGLRGEWRGAMREVGKIREIGDWDEGLELDGDCGKACVWVVVENLK